MTDKELIAAALSLQRRCNVQSEEFPLLGEVAERIADLGGKLEASNNAGWQIRNRLDDYGKRASAVISDLCAGLIAATMLLERMPRSRMVTTALVDTLFANGGRAIESARVFRKERP